MATGLHISLSAEPLFAVQGFTVTNSILTSLIVSAALLTFGAIARSSLSNTSKPTGLQNFAEWLVEAIYNLIHSVTNHRGKTVAFFPFIATFLLFILLNNWLGLVPGVGTIGVTHSVGEAKHASVPNYTVGSLTPKTHAATGTTDEAAHEAASSLHTEDEHATEVEHEEHSGDEHGTTFVPIFRPGTADLNTTMALALVSVITTQVIGVRYLGLSYFSKFLNFSNPIMFFVGILEIISELAKIISFAFRLFGNIFAGEVLLVVISALMPLVAPLPFYGLEVFVGFIQALVFAMLSLVFFNMATQSHDSH